MVRKLRNRTCEHGLILANGGVLTYQHAICLSTNPRGDGSAYPDRSLLPLYLTDIPVTSVSADAEGKATVEVSGRLTRMNFATDINALDLHG